MAFCKERVGADDMLADFKVHGNDCLADFKELYNDCLDDFENVDEYNTADCKQNYSLNKTDYYYLWLLRWFWRRWW